MYCIFFLYLYLIIKDKVFLQIKLQPLPPPKIKEWFIGNTSLRPFIHLPAGPGPRALRREPSPPHIYRIKSGISVVLLLYSPQSNRIHDLDSRVPHILIDAAFSAGCFEGTGGHFGDTIVLALDNHVLRAPGPSAFLFRPVQSLPRPAGHPAPPSSMNMTSFTLRSLIGQQI